MPLLLNYLSLVLLNLGLLCSLTGASPVITTAVDAASALVTVAPGTPKSTPTTATQSSTSCAYVARSPAPAYKFCGVQGHLHRPAIPLSTHPGKTSDQCLSHCLAAGSDGCRAFDLDLTVHICTLYNSSVNSQDFQASYTNRWFWSRKCFAEECTTSGGKNTTSSALHTSTIKSPLPTSKVSTKVSSGTGSLTASVPVTTVSKGPNTCVIPMPLAARDCKIIRVGIANAPYYVNYNLYFNGTGVVESPDNPGNRPGTLLPSFTTSISSSHSACDAATICAGNAAALGIGAVYMSFDLHYDLKTCHWMCTAFGGYNDNGTYFGVQDDNAFMTHGFAGKMKRA